jgi:hypothetical protein
VREVPDIVGVGRSHRGRTGFGPVSVATDAGVSVSVCSMARSGDGQDGRGLRVQPGNLDEAQQGRGAPFCIYAAICRSRRWGFQPLINRHIPKLAPRCPSPPLV